MTNGSATAPLDIAVLLPGVGVYGGVRRFIAIGNELVRRGHRYVIYHPDGTPPEWLPFAGQTRRLDDLANARHQVLICNNPPQLPAFERARADLKLFYFAMEGIPGERRIARHPGWTIVANSSGLAERLRRRYGVDAERAIGGIDLETFHPQRTRAPGPSHYRVLVFGRTSRKRKGTALAIRAVRAFARGRRDGFVTLVLFDHVEPGEKAPVFDAPHDGLDVETHFNLPQDQLAALYGSCDVFVSAERRAGWSNTVAEAMACGVPVVCTASGTRDVATHLETAWVARWRHPFFLRRGLNALHADAVLAGRLRTSAFERIRAFSWDRVADQVEAIIRRNLPTQ